MKKTIISAFLTIVFLCISLPVYADEKPIKIQPQKTTVSFPIHALYKECFAPSDSEMRFIKRGECDIAAQDEGFTDGLWMPVICNPKTELCLQCLNLPGVKYEWYQCGVILLGIIRN